MLGIIQHNACTGVQTVDLVDQGEELNCCFYSEDAAGALIGNTVKHMFILKTNGTHMKVAV